ncbi:unnamed protein product [Adineta ricciae]|uniref:Uncharacterized protein n=1 Tax=Adineta ricciae TaxID=249248 RepID=A0A813S5H4_ADIRI|nr:unnamed protein product [Adineta ricciae]CAF1235894.1 unnamed protein product [Adineta ricciae]
MLIPLIQVLFAAIRTVSRSAVNIMLYSILSRIFNQWFGFNTLITFFCSAYCLSKIVGYFQRMWLQARLKNKKPDEKILMEDLSWESDRMESNEKFESDWKYLLDDDTKHVFSSIVDIPFRNGWLFFGTMMVIDYQMNNYGYSYTYSLIRTVGFLIALISGAAIRYQTLLEREKQKFFRHMLKIRDEVERYIVYSKGSTPIASICLQVVNAEQSTVFMVQLCQLNSKFNDYIYDITDYICHRLFERVKRYSNETRKSIRMVWSIPTCKQNWVHALKGNKLVLRNTYKDYSFMPLVNSYVEQYEYSYQYEDLSVEPAVVEEKENDDHDDSEENE